MEELLEYTNLAEILFFANTPLYLYKRFRSNPSVQKLAESYTTKELINAFDKLIGKNDLTGNEVIQIYAIVMALSLQDNPEVREFFNKLDTYKTAWFKQIKNIYFSLYKPTTELTLDFKDKANPTLLVERTDNLTEHINLNFDSRPKFDPNLKPKIEIIK